MTNRQNPELLNGYLAPAFPHQVAFKNYSTLHPVAFNFLWSYKREKYLRKCIELAKANNINIYLYESPVYNESKKYNLNRAEFLNKIDDISKTYDINYLKFDTLPMSFENKNYFNALNTTLAGTDEFSFIFGNYIKNKILN